MRKCGIVTSLFLLSSLLLFGQSFNKNDFYEADMAMVSGDYVTAQRGFDRLVKSDPSNANLNYLNGYCLFNIKGREKESMDYLEKAAPYASGDYKYGSIKETNAPIDVVKYYAMACKLNNKLTKALELFNQYKSMLPPKDDDEIALIDKMIESCYTAQRMEQNPIFIRQYGLGDNLASEEDILYPVVNRDETMLFFAKGARFNRTEIFFSKKEEGVWTPPEKITTYLGVKSEVYPSSISTDNERLYLTVNTGRSTDIYYSVFSKDRWQKMIKLDKPVNDKEWDSHAYESVDGRSLYFSSDRKGGFGNMDLYVSVKDVEDQWSKPLNLGQAINTAQNELLPVVTDDNAQIFFKSEGHENIGGYDIFVSKSLGENQWSQSINIGYPVNTTGDDIHMMPVRNGKFAYTTMANSDGSPGNSLYLIEVFSADNPRKFNISGAFALQDGTTSFDDANIEVYSTTTYEKLLVIQPESQSGNFDFELTGGAYMINFVKPNYKTYTHLIDIPIDNPEDAMEINAFLENEMPVAEVVATTSIASEIITEETHVEEIQSVEVIEEVVEEAAQEPEVEVTAYETEIFIEETIREEPKASYTAEYGYEGKYTIQFMASIKEVSVAPVLGNNPVEIQKGEDRYYRYVTGVFDSQLEASGKLVDFSGTKYKGAFVRYYMLSDYLNRAAISPSYQYTIQIMALRKEMANSNFRGINNIKVSLGMDEIYRYTSGEFNTLKSAQTELESIISKGYSGAYIKKISDVSNY